MKMDKKKLATIAGAVALAAVMAAGSFTFAYLQDKTDPVTNNFNPNKVTVDLQETTGNTYEIIPGTSQTKDPKVSVDATVPSYVYVTVEDRAPGMLTYEIADGWTEINIPGTTASTSSYTRTVYYREIDGFYNREDGKWYENYDASADPAYTGEIQTTDISVLKDDKVSYDASLENSDMLKSNGTLKTNQRLIFTAQAVQKAGFDTPADGYAGATTNSVDSFNALKTSGNSILKADVTTDGVSTQIQKETNIDLNGHKITDNGSSTEAALRFLGPIAPQASITVKNGTIEVAEGVVDYGFWLSRGKSATLENVVIKGASTHAAYSENGDLIITGKDTYMESTCAGTGYFTINLLDSARTSGKATATVSGGTYKNFDPANNVSEGIPTSFLADGYHTEGFKIDNSGSLLSDASDYVLRTNYDAEDFAYYFVVVPDGQTAAYTGMSSGIPQFNFA